MLLKLDRARESPRDPVNAESAFLTRSRVMSTLPFKEQGARLAAMLMIWSPNHSYFDYHSGRHKQGQFCNVTISRLAEGLVLCDPCPPNRGCVRAVALAITVGHFMVKYSWPFYLGGDCWGRRWQPQISLVNFMTPFIRFYLKKKKSF